MNTKDLLNLKKEIEDAKTELSSLKGQHKTLLSQLKEDWDCKTLEEAKKKAKTMQEEIESLNESIEKDMKILEYDYL